MVQPRAETITQLNVKTPEGDVGVSLVADIPRYIEKYAMRLIDDLDNLFHVTINPPDVHITDILSDDGSYSALCLLDLHQQWAFVLRQITISIASMYQWFEELVIVPEKTYAGIIHFHCIARLKPGRQPTDVQRMFWRMFDVTLKNPNSAGEMKRFKDITKYMVHIDPVTDAGIVKYLFHKDKKDYEHIMEMKDSNDRYAFKPLYMHVYDMVTM